MDKLDWPALLRRVDEGFCTWRQPSLLLFGTSGACSWRPGCCPGQRLAAPAAAVWHLGGAPCLLPVAGSSFAAGLPSHLPSHLPNKQALAVLSAAADQFIELKSVFEWLESKRTCMKLASAVEAKLGHSPQVRQGGWCF